MDGTVLVADDDRTIRTVLTQALTRAGCKVHATSSLVTLMRWVEEGKGDLVISDVMMPDGNGIDRIPAIREARPDLPVIVISAQVWVPEPVTGSVDGLLVFDSLGGPALAERVGEEMGMTGRGDSLVGHQVPATSRRTLGSTPSTLCGTPSTLCSTPSRV